MLGTYVSLALILGASFVVGQAVFCAVRPSPALAPGARRRPGPDLRGRVAGATDVAASAWAGLGAVAVLTARRRDAASLRARHGQRSRARCPPRRRGGPRARCRSSSRCASGSSGTSLNPDMSQHLFAADRLVSGGEERLIAEGYPLGPHALAASHREARAIAGPRRSAGSRWPTAVAATVAPSAPLSDLDRSRRIGAALLVGVAYLAASYYIQGAFKETMQALFVLAFAIGLAELASESATEARGCLAGIGSRRVPLAALAVGSLYAYSFPGLTWLVGTAGHLGDRRGRSRAQPSTPSATPLSPASIGGRRRRRARRAGDPAHDRLRELRDLQPRRRGPRQPLQPDLADRGAGHLAIGRLPARSRAPGFAPAPSLLPRRG